MSSDPRKRQALGPKDVLPPAENYGDGAPQDANSGCDMGITNIDLDKFG